MPLQPFLDKDRRENALLRNQIDLLNDEISLYEKKTWKIVRTLAGN